MSEQIGMKRFRAMLNERGIEWQSAINPDFPEYTEDDFTFFHSNGFDWLIGVNEEGDLAVLAGNAEITEDGVWFVRGCTPEQAIVATLGDDAKLCHATEANYRQCKYSTNRGWCDDAPFLVWDDTGHLFVTMGGLKTWDVTDDAKTWFATLGKPNAASDQESIVRSFLRKISPNRDWDYLGEHEHALIADFVDEIAATLGGGKMTAEQVRETVEKHWHNLPDEYDMPEATALPEYSYDWQAIADELNAVLGSGACENKAKHWGEFECSECGFWAEFGSDLHRVNRCPDCGRVVER